MEGEALEEAGVEGLAGEVVAAAVAGRALGGALQQVREIPPGS